MTLGELTGKDWAKILGITKENDPEVLIIEGNWKFEERIEEMKKEFDNIIFQSKTNHFFIGKKTIIK
jgi:hypothetical protein|tara:strand:+ start:1513 stop:1713 length:201 start_codon:yes stop_codon:yes gene_type:complete